MTKKAGLIGAYNPKKIAVDGVFYRTISGRTTLRTGEMNAFASHMLCSCDGNCLPSCLFCVSRELQRNGLFGICWTNMTGLLCAPNQIAVVVIHRVYYIRDIRAKIRNQRIQRLHTWCVRRVPYGKLLAPE